MLGKLDQIAAKLFGSGPKEVGSASEQSSEAQEIVSFVRNKVEEARGSGQRIAQESVWMTNIAYLLGFDSVVFDSASRAFRSVGQPSRFLRRNRLHINKILPTVQNRLSRLCKNPPQFDVRPESSSVDDKDASRLSLDILKMVWEKEKVNEKRLTLMMWLQQCGYSFMKVCWDDSMGKPLVDPMTGESMGFEGDIRIEPISSFEIFVDPLAKTMDDAQWIVHANVRKLNYFKDRFPLGDLVKEEGAWLLSLQYEMTINGLSTVGNSSAASQMQMQNAAIELVYYEKRSLKHPRGRQITIANGIKLEDKELPVGEFNIVKFDDVIVAGKFASESIITHLRPVQDQYNRLITKRAEWTNRLLAGKYIAPKGHGMHVEALNDQSGEVVQYNVVPNAPPPMIMQIPVIPQYAYVEEEKLNAMILDISGINEVSRGQLPSASIPAAGMAILQEQDQSRIGVMSEQHEQAWAKVGQLILKYAQEYYKTDRILKIASSSMEYSVKKFVGADIKDNHDVICVRGSTIPTSKELKRQEIINAFNTGLLGDPKDVKLRQKVLGMLEYGDIAEVWNEMAIDQNQIKEHLDMIEKGGIPPREELDNHPLHIQEKNKYRKTDKFKLLNPVQQNILKDDIEWHVQAIIDLANPQLKQQKEMADQMVASAAQQPNQPPVQPQDLIDPHSHPAMQQPQQQSGAV